MNHVHLERRDLSASLSSWITTAMNMLNAAIARGSIGYVYWPEHRCPRAYHDGGAFSRCPNTFEWYFDQWWYDPLPASATETWVYEVTCSLTNQHPIADL